MEHSVAVRAPGKINLLLDITGVGSNGYHFLRTVMQSISLADELCLTRTDGEGITLSCSDPELPCDGTNLAVKAAKAYLHAAGLPETGISIELKKQIPQKAGLAGGSADAAGVLLGMNALFDQRLSTGTLMETAADLGADVPFCLLGGTALAEGIGEILTPLPDLSEDCVILLAKPEIGCSTPEVFSAYDRLVLPVHPDCDGLIAAVTAGKPIHFAPLCANILEQAVAFPEIARIKKTMLENGALGAAMTGSGSAVFGIFEKKLQARSCEDLLRKTVPFTAVCKPVSKGAEMK